MKNKNPKVVNPVGYIYAVGHRQHGWMKVGLASNLRGRMQNLQCGVPFKLEFFRFLKVKDMNKVESNLHYTLYNLRIRGEWFKLDEARLDAAIQEESDYILNEYDVRTSWMLLPNSPFEGAPPELPLESPK